MVSKCCPSISLKHPCSIPSNNVMDVQMNISCPVCDATSGLELMREEKTITVRNEPIPVDMEYYRCGECGEEFRGLEQKDDPFERAYRLYRAKHGMVQPEYIRTFRRKYSLTQGELANLLGLGGATLSRYEKGALQDRTHDTLMRMAIDPANLRELVFHSTDVFSTDKRNRVLRLIDGVTESTAGIFEHVVAAAFQHHEADEYSGFKKFDNDKFFNAVLFFSRDGVTKTKLNKLLFYADFKYFKEYTISITGARYARIPFGPAPDGYDLYYPILVRQGSIEVEEMSYEGKEYTGEKYTSKAEANLNIFLESELEVLLFVNRQFKNHNASDISEFSHEEKGYQHAKTGDSISYSYAQQLRL